jgi:hypothetical protein
LIQSDGAIVFQKSETHSKESRVLKGGKKLKKEKTGKKGKNKGKKAKRDETK